MKYTFERDAEGKLIYISAKIDEQHELKMMLDTGASGTTIDSNVLRLCGYALDQPTETATIETANGVINTDVFCINSIASLGLTRNEFPIQVYDFLIHGILSDYDGVLGLDFFEDTDIHINMKRCTIEVKDLS
jgi:hypothetical protein